MLNWSELTDVPEYPYERKLQMRWIKSRRDNKLEEPLPAGGSCLLGSINLSAFVKNPFTDNAEFDGSQFTKVARLATKALNDVLDEGLPLHPLEIQRDCVRDWRQIGLGMFGLGDALIMLGIKYGSPEAVRFSNDLAETLAKAAIRESEMLAEGDGKFPKFDVNAFLSSSFGQRLGPTYHEPIADHGVRNSQLLTIAPTGTLATMLGISSGIEPIYALSYTRKTESLHGHDEYYQINAKIVEDYSKVSGKTDLPDYFVGSSDISIDSRIAMQAAWQEWIDASISSTVNLPEDTSVDDIQALYMKAWKAGLKGLTVFRNNCKRVGILTTPVADPEPEANDRESDMVIPRGYIIDVPEELTYRKYKIQSGCGKLYLFVGVDESERRIYDVFTNTDGTGGCSINTQANSRLLSACVRGGVPVEYVIEQLKKSGTCPNYQYSRGAGKKLSPGKSCPSSIAYILQEILNEFNDDEGAELSSKPEMVDVPEAKSTHIVYAEKCPECGTESLIHDGGCTSCTACGYGKCS